MLKKSIGLGLLFIAGQTFGADITVTTTLDNDVNDKECSLREAIHYINMGMPKEGYHGCGGENSTNTILLKEKEIYKLTEGHLVLNVSATIKTFYETNVTQTVNKGLKNAVIQAANGKRILLIEKGEAPAPVEPEEGETATPVVIDLPSVKIEEITLQGSDQNPTWVDKGGLIYADAYLTLDYVKLTSGHADKGGAIYSPNTDGKGYLAITNTLIESNEAQQGGAIYTKLLSIRIRQSVIRKNKTSDAQFANLFSETGLSQTNSAYLTNSTLYSNTGPVLWLNDGLVINNTTILANQGAGIVYAGSESKLGSIANSIILKNNENCKVADGSNSTNTIVQNNLTTSLCGAGETAYPNRILEDDQNIIAGNDVEGTCPNIKQENTAILCPFSEKEDQFLGYFRPRILLSYLNITDSPIVNQGAAEVVDNKILSCEGNDQRNNSRPTIPFNVGCDRGAIEIVVPTSSMLVGRDLKMGEIAKFSILDALGDSDLVPKENCNAIVGPAPQGQEWQDGCIKIEQQNHVTSKGKITIDLDGNVTYTPNGNWHGADLLTMKVVTTTSRFDESDPYISVRVNIVQEPNGEMKSDKVKTSGGAVGFGWLGILLGLAVLRRKK
ncbi:rhombotarget A [Acinetobacter sp. NCu2D-2]|uniref:rhombotarget A n=1 Tax=Acinetobacter sp. NCu2D-2 TaxID=1608473 RepID=UPI0007CE0B51|nr:rhombotarget A [Acinetobacter sp. NCu2D-2]ANF82177.1 rhombotarget A [Acinetobacter sp. NCu2D-2]